MNDEDFDEVNLIAERERGHLAQQITKNPLWVETWEAIEDGLLSAWRHTGYDDSGKREAIWHQLDAVRAVRKSFDQVVMTGKLAEMQIEEERSDGRKSSTRSTTQH